MIASRELIGTFSSAFLVVAVLQSAASAQLFGNQTIGTSPSQLRSPFGNASQGARGTTSLGAPTGQAGQAGVPGAGLLDGNERFVRGNRSRQDFVGTGRNDLTGFVGAGQAIGVGRVPAATDNFRLETMGAARINKPLPKQPAKGMYYPRLVLDLESKSVESDSAATAVAAPEEIQRRAQAAGGENIQVFVADGTAILRGTVHSKRAAELVMNVLSFEPGIDSIDNQMSLP